MVVVNFLMKVPSEVSLQHCIRYTCFEVLYVQNLLF